MVVQLLLIGLLLQQTEVHLQCFPRVRQQDQLGLEGLFELREMVGWFSEVLIDEVETLLVELLVVVAGLCEFELSEDLGLCLRGKEGSEAIKVFAEVELPVICGFFEVQALVDNLEDVLVLCISEQIELNDSLQNGLYILFCGLGYYLRKLDILKNEGKILQFLLILSLQFFLNSLADGYLLAQRFRFVCLCDPDFVPAEILQLKQPLQGNSQVLESHIDSLHVFSQRFFSFSPGEFLEILTVDAIICQFLQLGPVAQNGIFFSLIISGLLKDEKVVLVNDILEQLLNELLIRSFLFLQNIFDRSQPIDYNLFFGVAWSFGNDHPKTAQEFITE